MGACSVNDGTGNGFTVFGNRRVSIVTVTMSSSYTTGGDTLTAAQLGLVHISFIECALPHNSSATQDGYTLAVNIATGNQSATIQAFGDGGDSAGGPLIEAASGVNLSTYTFNVIAYGY